MARGGADELLLPGELPHHRPPGLQQAEQAKILAQHLLLAAKAAADPLGENMEIARAKLEDVAELLLGDEGRLRTGTDVDSSILATPGDGTVGFQMDVLDARG